MNIEDIFAAIAKAPPSQRVASIDQLIGAWRECRASDRHEEAGLLEETIRAWFRRRARQLRAEHDPVLMQDFWAWVDGRCPFKIERRDDL